MIKKSQFREIIRAVMEEQIRIMAKAEDLSDWDQITITDDGVNFDLEMPEKYWYVVWGRRAGTHKGVRIPIQALIKWIRKKNIQPQDGYTVNQLAWAIQTAIYNNGTKNMVMPRDFIKEGLDKVAAKFPTLADIINLP